MPFGLPADLSVQCQLQAHWSQRGLLCIIFLLVREYEPLGAILGHLGAILRSSWGLLGPSWGLLGPTWKPLGAMLGHLGVILGPLGAILVPSWGHLEVILGPLGANLGSSWGLLGSLGHIGAIARVAVPSARAPTRAFTRI